ncbi:uncharacterized protein G2W53_001061 [Senna tora]|uniref:Uncharacterized protein n=1 Tax=Senna tora TaxID=362788 RepID=A0A835CK05_9FABA|nr:uncharacterized protein G2W53_001061 [Senna tora]
MVGRDCILEDMDETRVRDATTLNFVRVSRVRSAIALVLFRVFGNFELVDSSCIVLFAFEFRKRGHINFATCQRDVVCNSTSVGSLSNLLYYFEDVLTSIVFNGVRVALSSSNCLLFEGILCIWPFGEEGIPSSPLASVDISGISFEFEDGSRAKVVIRPLVDLSQVRRTYPLYMPEEDDLPFIDEAGKLIGNSYLAVVFGCRGSNEDQFRIYFTRLMQQVAQS